MEQNINWTKLQLNKMTIEQNDNWTKHQLNKLLIEQLKNETFGKSSFVELTDVECSIDLVKLTFCSIKNIQCWIGTLFNL